MKINYKFRFSILGLKYFIYFHLGLYSFTKFFKKLFHPIYHIKYGNVKFKAVYENFDEAFRIARWFVKEPETIEWMEAFPKNSVFFDVGANIGLYSIFAAKIRDAEVYSFEPFWENFFHFKENIALNDLKEKVHPFNFGLSDRSGLTKLLMDCLESGSSGAQVGRDFNYLEQKMTVKGSQPIAYFSLDYICSEYIKKYPNYLKIDVDGIEPLIIQGAKTLLASHELREIMVELTSVKENQESYDGTIKLLADHGFILKEKYRVASDTRVMNHLFAKKMA